MHLEPPKATSSKLLSKDQQSPNCRQRPQCHKTSAVQSSLSNVTKMLEQMVDPTGMFHPQGLRGRLTQTRMGSLCGQRTLQDQHNLGEKIVKCIIENNSKTAQITFQTAGTQIVFSPKNAQTKEKATDLDTLSTVPQPDYFSAF